MKKVLLHFTGILTVIFMIFILGLFVGRQQVLNDSIPRQTTSATNQHPNIESKKLNINTASVDELCTLPGVGQVTANAIIEYRTTHGPIESPEQLIDIKGIGLKKFNEILDLITFE